MTKFGDKIEIPAEHRQAVSLAYWQHRRSAIAAQAAADAAAHYHVRLWGVLRAAVPLENSRAYTYNEPEGCVRDEGPDESGGSKRIDSDPDEDLRRLDALWEEHQKVSKR